MLAALLLAVDEVVAAKKQLDAARADVLATFSPESDAAYGMAKLEMDLALTLLSTRRGAHLEALRLEVSP